MKYAFIVLTVSLAGCSKMSGSTSQASTTLPTINALQDQNFSHALAASGSGAFTISALPAWVSFNATTGVFTGIPTTYANSFDFYVTQGSAPQAGYHVQVVGNPLKEFQWHLKNTGQSAFAFSNAIAGNDINLAQTIAGGITGSGVKVAISDSGVVLAHEGLSANVAGGLSRNYLNNYPVTHTWSGDPTPDETEPDNAHGTAVAGLAVEKGWNGLGGRGVAPDAQFAGFEFIPAQSSLNNLGLTQAGTLDQFNGTFDVYNYSWGDAQCAFSDDYGTSLSDAMLAGVTNQRGGKGAIYVRAAGNSYADSNSDCNGSGTFYGNAQSSEFNTLPYQMIVGASNASGVRSSYSTPGANIWINAPGGEYGLGTLINNEAISGMPALISTDFPGCGTGLKSFYFDYSAFDYGLGLNASCNYTSTMNGTSGATPIVTGAVALLLQANPSLTWRDVKYVLAKTADKIDASVNPATHPNPAKNMAGHVYEQGWITNQGGFNFMNYYGFGRINVDHAVALAQSYVSPLGTYQNTGWSEYGTSGSWSIPPGATTGYSSSFTVSENLTVEEVQVNLSVSNCAANIGIELQSPGTTVSHLANINGGTTDTAINAHTYLSNAFYGEASAGIWTLKLVNASSTCTANLTQWALNVFGH